MCILVVVTYLIARGDGPVHYGGRDYELEGSCTRADATNRSTLHRIAEWPGLSSGEEALAGSIPDGTVPTAVFLWRTDGVCAEAYVLEGGP
jgi:hypothetical protein